MKVYMTPQPNSFRGEESGIRRVVENYARHGPQFGIEYVADINEADIAAVHASGAEHIPPDMPMVAHCHGIYWSADYPASDWELKANKGVINTLRRANTITVPTNWVAETIARDMRVMPRVLPHGIDWHDWQHNEESQGYVLWNKNRGSDVCSPEPVRHLAREFKNTLFWTTYIDGNPSTDERGRTYIGGKPAFNVRYLNSASARRPRIVPHDQMKLLVQQCVVYLSTTKETFGIGTLEAMAAGKPVLGWNHGGNTDLIEHGVSGYLATPGDYDDLFEGMRFCLEHAAQLGENGRELAKRWTWEGAVEQLEGIYSDSLHYQPPDIGVVITRFKQPFEVVKRAIDSVKAQTRAAQQVIVVNDGGPGFEPIANYCDVAIDKENGGVASARNAGIESLFETKYIACLDADDWWEPNYLELTAAALDAIPLAGIAYTGLTQHNPNGTEELSHWPPPQNYDRQCNYERRYNQVISGALFRREAWKRVGGYRGRYCPTGAGSEDAAFWTAIGSIGYEAVKVTDAGLFNYSAGGHTSNPDYREVDWLAWYPWSRDKLHPFASVASPANHWSHLVRQYDEPVISVIIPVGPGHGDYVADALDSLESQHFRKWEVIVVDDTGDGLPGASYVGRPWFVKIEDAYPYVRWERTAGREGAGFARNLGAMAARGRFLLFLDADDYLNPTEPGALGEMVRMWGQTESAVYSDYWGVSTVEDPGQLAEDLQKRIINRNQKTGETIIEHRAAPYDCARAVKQPEAGIEAANLYLWCNISTLIPTSWHFEIGGFDENMPTWEDVDYWYRMARAGKCFYRLERPALVYRFHSGGRRNIAHAQNEQGRHNWHLMVEYMLGKYEEIDTMPCSGCSKSRRKPGPTPVEAANMSGEFEDNSFRLVAYVSPNVGAHQVNGAPHFDYPPPMNHGKRSGKYFIRYGRHPGGGKRRFKVHIKDIASMPNLFEVVSEEPLVELPQVQRPAAPTPVPVKHIPEPKAAPPPPPAPVAVKEEKDGLNLQLLPITAALRAKFEADGLTTAEAIRAKGLDGLKQYKGIGAAKARAILGMLDKLTE